MTDPLDLRFQALLEPGRPDWLDVQRRLRRRPRRISLVAAVGALFLAVPTVAIALDPTILPWNNAAPAPRTVVHDFATLVRGAPPGMNPHVRPGEARTVPLPDGGTVWVAPAANSGFCEQFAEAKWSGCDQTRAFPIDATVGNVGSVECGASAVDVPAMVSGHVNATAGSTLSVEFSGGTTAALPLSWVGPPINAGFFERQIPAGHRMTALVLRDSGGSIIAQDSEIFRGLYTQIGCSGPSTNGQTP
jgi:hypothetical protein